MGCFLSSCPAIFELNLENDIVNLANDWKPRPHEVVFLSVGPYEAKL